jgi:hypothetical protein
MSGSSYSVTLILRFGGGRPLHNVSQYLSFLFSAMSLLIPVSDEEKYFLFLFLERVSVSGDSKLISCLNFVLLCILKYCESFQLYSEM